MDVRALAEQLLRDHLLAASALTAQQLRQLSPDAQAHLNDAILSGTGHVELRTRIDPGEVELLLVPADGSDALWLTRMAERGDDGRGPND
jgi:hypothetical protein